MAETPVWSVFNSVKFKYMQLSNLSYVIILKLIAFYIKIYRDGE